MMNHLYALKKKDKYRKRFSTCFDPAFEEWVSTLDYDEYCYAYYGGDMPDDYYPKYYPRSIQEQ